MEHLIFSGKDNTISIVLESRDAGGEWAPISMASITDVSLDFGATVISSTTSPTAISWALTSVPLYTENVYVVTLKLGASGLAIGQYVAHVIIKDPNYPNGLVWANMAIQVVNLG